jgi:outer membrane lipoprotein-sorting protein
MRKFMIISIAVLIFSLSFADLLTQVASASDNLKTVQCIITATNHSKRVVTIQYIFKFKRDGKKMYIEYLKPYNMKGAKISIDGKYFYNYIPNLHRLMKKKLTSTNSANNPGKEMGILYDFVNGTLNNFLKDKKAILVKESNTTFEYQFSSPTEKEIVVFDKSNYFPIRISIYLKGKLVLDMEVKNLILNKEIKDSVFVLGD